MLFNTLVYAKFLAVVFTAIWLLRRRVGSVWLPALALLATACFGAEPLTVVPTFAVILATISLFGGLVLWRFTRTRLSDEHNDEPPAWSLAILSSALHIPAIAWVAHAGYGQNIFEYVVRNCLGFDATAVRGDSYSGASSVGVSLAAAVGATLLCSAGLRATHLRLWLTLIASYVFYARWDYRFVALIFASSSVDYWLGLRIAATEDARQRRRWLLLTIVLNLGVLCGFKYLNFGIATLSAVLHSIGVAAPLPVLSIALPIGISFFTFESMSYVIDVYRRHLKPHQSYLEYLCFVAFFPHLVAGPIVRPRDLLPQLAQTPQYSEARASRALHQIACGLLKKVAIGDYLALNLVDRVFDAPTQYSSLEVYTAVVAYAVQIYCDFSGYTDIAIGSAALLGIEFPANFDAPYKATSIQDFWRRWHISLSTWLRDYLYISLGGSRQGEIRTYVNLFLTMLLGGLWHGANFTFVVWGALHGALLVIHRLYAQLRGPKWPPLLAQLATFHCVCVTWIFFRSPNFTAARAIFSQLFIGSGYTVHLFTGTLVALAAGLLSHWAPERWAKLSRESYATFPGWAQSLALLLVCLVLREVASSQTVPFVYFQF